MKFFKLFSIKLFSLLLAVLLVGTACSDDDDGGLSQEQMIEQMLDEVRALTADYDDIEAAMEAGWNVDLSGCVEHPTEGGMGHHYGRPEYIDGRVNYLEPQVLLYAPTEDGDFEFVGVEYIVPFAIHSADSEPPELFYQEFHQNHIQEIWALHVWTERENSSGTFYDWNPTVSCEHSQENRINQMLDEVRTLTADYHDIETAMEAGWNVDLSGCVEHPTEGGMGHHYGRPEYIDGRVNYLEPQVLLYAPIEGGFEFVGVEYIVPFAIHSADSEPPELFYQEFHQNHVQEIWALHVWTERENPSGTFYDWNPTVSCE
nr:hypothetical protein [Saprospiraceae bacterium]